MCLDALLGAGIQSGIQSSLLCPRHRYLDSSNWKTGKTTAKASQQKEIINFLFLRSTFLKPGIVISLSLFECWIKCVKDSIMVIQIWEVPLVLIFYGGDCSDRDGWLVEWKTPHDWEPLSMDGC